MRRMQVKKRRRPSLIIREIFTGNAGELSSKRAMMFLSFIVMLFMAYASIFMEKSIQQFIFDGFLYIVVGSLFSVASEKFSRKFSDKISTRVNPDEYIEDDTHLDGGEPIDR